MITPPPAVSSRRVLPLILGASLVWLLASLPTAQATPAADNAWQELEKLQHELQADAPKGVNEVEFYAPIQAKLHQAAADFAAKNPTDPRRWDAKVSVIRTQEFPADADARRAIFETNETILRSILAAGDAPPKTKQDAERAVLRQHLDHLDLIQTPEQAIALEARLTDYLGRFPDDPKAAPMQIRRIDLWQRVDPAKAKALLDEMATSSDEKIAAAAKGRQAQKALTAAPLDWKLTALDGKPIDFTALRGKVVLVDFWASWCPDCMRELPAVLAAYSRFHERGLEIVGVSLDNDEGALRSTIKKRGVPWPQVFDGKGWNSDLAVRYGVKGIPEMWLVGPSGHIVATGVQTDQLEQKINALLPPP